MTFESFLETYQLRTEKNLADLFLKIRQKNSSIEKRTKLLQAMEYACLNGGKRLRPLLVYATGMSLNTPTALLDNAALAVELIHCYSLIHDDLPAMDNDDLRRGKPTCHKAFDEATAILAGDALQTLAFQILGESSAALPDSVKLKMLNALSEASGYAGMGGGQALDLVNNHLNLNMEDLSHTHLLKTGALIHASIQLGALPNADRKALSALKEFAYHFGLGFQVQDDVLDVIGSPEKTGKKSGSDERQHKTTYTTLLGVVAAKNYADECYQASLAALSKMQIHFSLLQDMVEWMRKRTD